MVNEHKIIVEKINAACASGDTEAFLSYLLILDNNIALFTHQKLYSKTAFSQS